MVSVPRTIVTALLVAGPMVTGAAGCADPVDSPLAELGSDGLMLIGAPICPGSPYTTIQAAINAATSGGTVTVCDGTFFERLTISAKNLTLVSQNGSALTTVDAAGLAPALTITNGSVVTVDGFTFANGATAGTGGNVSSSSSTLVRSDNRLVSGSAGAGGGLGVTACSGSASGNTFEANYAWDGGGAWIDSDAFPVSGNTFVANTVDNRGGGAFLAGTLLFSNNTVESNFAVLYGGGVFRDGADGDVTGNTFLLNTSDDDGAGLYINEGLGIVSDNTFELNDAGDDGGGLRMKLSGAMVLDNTFLSNHADNIGGGAKISHMDTTITGNTFTDNDSYVAAGALMLEECASYVAFNTYTDNDSEDGGAVGIENGWDPVEIEDSTFLRNEASDTGGHIWVSLPLGPETRIKRVTMVGGVANQGGSIYAIDSIVQIDNVSMRLGTAWTSGGAMYLSGTSGSITNSVAWANDSAGGSGIRISNGAVGLDIVNTVFGGGTGGGAALHLSSGLEPTVRYSDFFKNGGINYTGMLDQTGLNGNLAVNPGFRNAKKGNFRLAVGSALLDAGDASILDTDGTRSDIGRWGGPDAF